MSSKTRLCSLLTLLTAGLLLCSGASADMSLNSASASITAVAKAGEEDRQEILSSSGSIGGARMATSEFNGYIATSTISSSIAFNFSSSSATISGQTDLFVDYTEGEGTPSGGNSVAASRLVFEFVVTGAPMQFHYEATLSGSVTGVSNDLVRHEAVFNSLPKLIETCTGSVCFPGSTRQEDVVLDAGTYRMEIADIGQVFSSGANESAELSSSWLLTIGPPDDPPIPCDFFWINPEGGIFTDPDNWLSGGSPGNPSTGCDDVFFNLGGGQDYTVAYLDATADSATFRGDTVHLAGDTLTVAGTGSDGNSGLLLIGAGALVELGTDPPTNDLIATSAFIGDIPGAQASMLISAPDSRLDLTESLIVGGLGPGTLIVTAGNVFSADTDIGLVNGGDGDVFLENSDVTLETGRLDVGIGGQGTLAIKNEALVFCTEANVGGFSKGIVTVENTAELQCEGPVTLGIDSGGEGILSVLDGAEMFGNILTVGSGSKGKLEVVDSQVGITGSAQVGLDGFGDVDMTGGIMMIGGDMTIGVLANGIVTTRKASLLEAQNIVVGSTGDPLGAANGGSLVTGNDCAVTARDSVSIGELLAFGIATVKNRGELTSPIIRVGPLGTLLLEPLSNVTGGVILNGVGRIVPASAEDKQESGPAVIDGNLTLGPDAQLIIEVDDPSMPALEVLGATTLSGELVVEIPTDTVLTANQELQLVNFTGGVIGGFTNITIPLAPPGFVGDAVVVGDVVRLTVVDPGVPTGGGGGGGCLASPIAPHPSVPYADVAALLLAVAFLCKQRKLS